MDRRVRDEIESGENEQILPMDRSGLSVRITLFHKNNLFWLKA